MNEQDIIDTNDILTDEIIVSYLQDNPDFFLRNPELLNSLRLADNQRGVVSLVERQQQLLRQKVHGLEEEITQLMSIAQHNESLFSLYNDLYLCLIDCQSLPEILNNLHKTTTELLSLADCKLWLNCPTQIDHPAIITNNCEEVLTTRLANEPFYFGRLQQTEQEALFGESIAGSAVLIRLSHLDEIYGFLAITSNDVEHFDPKMDTLLLGQFRKLVGKLIHTHLHANNQAGN
ncbi:MAG: DUF484 family protein [Thalassotalea sp.]